LTKVPQQHIEVLQRQAESGSEQEQRWAQQALASIQSSGGGPTEESARSLLLGIHKELAEKGDPGTPFKSGAEVEEYGSRLAKKEKASVKANGKQQSDLSKERESIQKEYARLLDLSKTPSGRIMATARMPSLLERSKEFQSRVSKGAKKEETKGLVGPVSPSVIFSKRGLVTSEDFGTKRSLSYVDPLTGQLVHKSVAEGVKPESLLPEGVTGTYLEERAPEPGYVKDPVTGDWVSSSAVLGSTPMGTARTASLFASGGVAAVESAAQREQAAVLSKLDPYRRPSSIEALSGGVPVAASLYNVGKALEEGAVTKGDLEYVGLLTSEPETVEPKMEDSPIPPGTVFTPSGAAVAPGSPDQYKAYSDPSQYSDYDPDYDKWALGDWHRTAGYGMTEFVTGGKAETPSANMDDWEREYDALLSLTNAVNMGDRDRLRALMDEARDGRNDIPADYFMQASRSIEAGETWSSPGSKTDYVKARIEGSPGVWGDFFQYVVPFYGTYKTGQERGLKSGWTWASGIGDVLLVAPVVGAVSKGTVSTARLVSLGSKPWAPARMTKAAEQIGTMSRPRVIWESAKGTWGRGVGAAKSKPIYRNPSRSRKGPTRSPKGPKLSFKERAFTGTKEVAHSLGYPVFYPLETLKAPVRLVTGRGIYSPGLAADTRATAYLGGAEGGIRGSFQGLESGTSGLLHPKTRAGLPAESVPIKYVRGPGGLEVRPPWASGRGEPVPRRLVVPPRTVRPLRGGVEDLPTGARRYGRPAPSGGRKYGRPTPYEFRLSEMDLPPELRTPGTPEYFLGLEARKPVSSNPFVAVDTPGSWPTRSTAFPAPTGPPLGATPGPPLGATPFPRGGLGPSASYAIERSASTIPQSLSVRPNLFRNFLGSPLSSRNVPKAFAIKGSFAPAFNVTAAAFIPMAGLFAPAFVADSGPASVAQPTFTEAPGVQYLQVQEGAVPRFETPGVSERSLRPIVGDVRMESAGPQESLVSLGPAESVVVPAPAYEVPVPAYEPEVATTKVAPAPQEITTEDVSLTTEPVYTEAEIVSTKPVSEVELKQPINVETVTVTDVVPTKNIIPQTAYGYGYGYGEPTFYNFHGTPFIPFGLPAFGGAPGGIGGGGAGGRGLARSRKLQEWMFPALYASFPNPFGSGRLTQVLSKERRRRYGGRLVRV